MNPGLLKHLITFQQANVIEDELSQEIEEWTDYKSLRAMIKTMKGSEYFAAASVQAERTYRFIIRYRNDIDNSMRILYKGRIFDIVEPPINDDEENKTLTIIAKERI